MTIDVEKFTYEAPVWTLITVTYNSSAVLQRFWTAPPPADVEWIVVDNASTDGSADVARACGASRVLTLDKNRGFGRANNLGFAQAQGTYVAFVNPDVTVDYSSLTRLASSIDRHDGLVAPQLLNHDGSIQPNGRGFPTLRNKIGNRTGRDVGDYFITAADDERKYICWAIGAAIAGRRETLERIGVWDRKFFIYYEDSDICLRSWTNHVPVELDGAVTWTHGWARATTRFRVKPWIHEISSMSRFYRKYPKLVWSESTARRRFPTITALLGASSEATVVPVGSVRE